MAVASRLVAPSYVIAGIGLEPHLPDGYFGYAPQGRGGFRGGGLSSWAWFGRAESAGPGKAIDSPCGVIRSRLTATSVYPVRFDSSLISRVTSTVG